MLAAVALSRSCVAVLAKQTAVNLGRMAQFGRPLENPTWASAVGPNLGVRPGAQDMRVFDSATNCGPMTSQILDFPNDALASKSAVELII